MKKILTILAIAPLSFAINAQEIKSTVDSTGLWLQDKNGGTNVNFGIGTNSPNYRLEIFGTSKTHGNAWFDSTLNIGGLKLFGSSSQFQNSLWQSPLKRLMMSNEDGFLVPMEMGQSNQVLYGNGVWGNLPTTNQLWGQNGSTIFYNQGYVGIGTQYPVFQLDVQGDARISSNLYVGGGIVISDKMRANEDVKTRSLDADSIKMGLGKVIVGETKVEGDVKLKYQLDVTGNATFHGNQYIDGGQFLQGNQDVQGSLIARQGLTFDGVKGFRHSLNSNGNSIFKLGGPNSTDPVTPCEFPSQSDWFYFGGKIQLFDENSNTSLTMGSDGYQTLIESEGNNGLLMNWYCGKDISLCTGDNTTSSNGRGGVVRMGHNVMIGNPYPGNNYDIALNINGLEQTGLFVNSYSSSNPYNYGIVSSVNGENNKAFAVLYQNANNDKEAFALTGNGSARFGGDNASIMPTLFVSPSIVNNQFTVGRVGIGTNTPSEALEIVGNLKLANLANGTTRSLYVDGSGKIVPGQPTSTTSVAWDLGGNTNTNGQAIGTLDPTSDLPFLSGGNEKMRLSSQGNLIIKRSNSENLSIGSAAGQNLNYGTSYIGFNTQRTSQTGSGSWTQYTDYSHNGAGLIFGNVFGEIGFSPLPSTSNGTTNATFSDADVMSHQTMRISWNSSTNTGQVFIGAKRPTAAPYNNMALSVDGSIIAKEIYVRDQQGAQWADYVFNKDYKLTPLNEVENYISDNKHLPNVPSACDVEEKGQSIGQLQVVQMEKIEELYLYVIELNKKVEALKKENEELKKKMGE